MREESENMPHHEKLKQKIKKALQLCDDQSRSSGKLITEHLEPCGDNNILLVLKGHCIIESLLESILIRQLDIESLPQKSGRLAFFIKKLKLGSSFGGATQSQGRM